MAQLKARTTENKIKKSYPQQIKNADKTKPSLLLFHARNKT